MKMLLALLVVAFSANVHAQEQLGLRLWVDSPAFAQAVEGQSAYGHSASSFEVKAHIPTDCGATLETTISVELLPQSANTLKPTATVSVATDSAQDEVASVCALNALALVPPLWRTTIALEVGRTTLFSFKHPKFPQSPYDFRLTYGSINSGMNAL